MKLDGIPSTIGVTTDSKHTMVIKIDDDTQEFIAETVQVVLLSAAGLMFFKEILRRIP